jgi:co-chaperonin GroES (HSP10)
MRLFAKNNYLIVEIESQKAETNPLSGFISAQGLKTHNVAKIIDSCYEGKFSNEIGNKILFQSHLLETFNIDGETYHILPEGAVYGVFRKEKSVTDEY